MIFIFKLPSHIRAICLLKLDRFQEAKQDCDSAVQLDPSNKKAFYRRALAFKGLKVPDRPVTCSDWTHRCIRSLMLGLCVCVHMSGLPVSQQWPPGGPPAGPEGSGGWAGAGGGDGFAEAKPDWQLCAHAKGKSSNLLMGSGNLKRTNHRRIWLFIHSSRRDEVRGPQAQRHAKV